jgi:phage-related protein
MSWTVEALDEAVKDEIIALPRDMRSKLEHISLMIATLGLERMREPYVRHLQGALWELRLIGRDGIARAI